MRFQGVVPWTKGRVHGAIILAVILVLQALALASGDGAALTVPTRCGRNGVESSVLDAALLAGGRKYPL